MLSDPTYSTDIRSLVGGNGARNRIGGLGFTDPPDHTALRKILMPHFTARRLAALQPAEIMAQGPLLLAGVEMYEYEPTMFHNKMLIVDHHLVSVGSTNFDLRSFQLNDEASLNVYDTQFANRMTEVFERDLKQTKQYTYQMWSNRPWKEKFAERFIQPLKSQL